MKPHNLTARHLTLVGADRAKDSGFAVGVASALAYRNVGLQGAAHIANPLYYIVGAGFGLLGLVLIGVLIFMRGASDPDPSAIWTVSVLLVGVGTYCVYTLRTMRRARELLDAWTVTLNFSMAKLTARGAPTAGGWGQSTKEQLQVQHLEWAP